MTGADRYGPRWGPSGWSRWTCSGCGTLKADLTLAERTYVCPACGLVIDRDLNAAINLARYTPDQDTPSRDSHRDIKKPPPLAAAA